LDENVDKYHLEAFPLAMYAAKNWVKHAKYEDVSSRVEDAMELFFNPRKPYLAAWVRLHDVADRSVDPPSPLGKAALYFAALYGFSGVANSLITHSEVDIAEFRHSGAPLHVASSRGHIGVVYLLLQHNVNVNAECTSYHNWTPLHFASFNGYAKVAQLLLERGANINARSATNRTPLMFASQRGHLEVVRLLLSNGADVTIRGEVDGTAFQHATVSQRFEVAQLLLEHGAEKE
jgi:ankyrin repeat protein